VTREIEAKFRLNDPARLRARLGAHGARRVGCVHETNRIFDTAGRKLLAADCGLRLRACRPLDNGGPPATHTLTYKGPRAPGSTKMREEIETVVADADATATILQRLGFNEVIVYEKRRETWRLDDCEVCLDELPKLGWFVEIEGPSREAVEAARTRLELSAATPLYETYVELAATHGDPGPTGMRCLRFEA
jgi:adenylate cyclase class 2